MKITQVEKQKKVAIYLRVSTEDQKEKFGIKLQKEAVINLLKSKKLSDGRDLYLIDDDLIFQDDISGTTPMDERPGFRRLMEELDRNEKKPFDVVAVYKIDRFARRLKILLNIIDLLETRDVKFLSANESIDTTTPFGKAMLGIIGVIAELEIETTKLRTQDGRKQAIKQGVWMGGTPPYGYIRGTDKSLEVLDVEATVIRQIFDMFVNQNYSAQQIADYLTKNKVASSDASSVLNKKRRGQIKKKNEAHFWRADQIVEVLSNEVYIGKYIYGKTKDKKRVPRSEWKISPHRHEPIIDDYLFKLAQHIVKSKGQYVTQKIKPDHKHDYLLSGLIKCSSCRATTLLTELPSWVGDRKKVKSTGQYSYYYKCGNRNTRKTSHPCTVLPLPAEKIENYVVEYVKKLLSNPVAVFDYQQELKSNKLEIKRLRERRDQLRRLLNKTPIMISRIKEQHELGVTSTEDMITKVREYEADQQRIEKELNHIELQIGKKANYEAYEKSLKLFSKKYVDTLDNVVENRQKVMEILHMLVDGIVVHARKPKIGEKIPGRKRGSLKKVQKSGEKIDFKPGEMKIRTVQEMQRVYEATGPFTDQMVPSEIDIYLKLPQQIMINMAREKVLLEDDYREFGANSDEL